MNARTVRLVVLGAVALVVCAGIYSWLHLHKEASREAGAATSANGMDEYSYSPAPHVSMRINGVHNPVVYQGTPLLLSFRAANQRATNAELMNLNRKERWKALQEKFVNGQIQKEELDEFSASPHRELPIKAVELGGNGQGWEQFLHFILLLPNRTLKPLPWKFERIGSGAEEALLLDAEKTIEVNFGLSPESAADILPGDYVLVGILDATNASNLPAGQWHGRAETEPIPLKILAQQTPPSAPEKARNELEYVRFFLATNRPEEALKHAEAAATISPEDIDAQIALGDSKAKQNDLQGALAGYQLALRTFYNQTSLPYEPPSLLIYKRAMLREQLQAHAN